MKISNTLATLFAVVFLGLSYFEYVPVYVSVTIAICAFITYLSATIVAAGTALQEVIKDEHKKNIECILKPVESIFNKLDVLIQVTENIKLQNDSLITQIENCSKNIENVINEHNEQSNRILSEIKLQKDSNVQRIEDICNSLKTYLSNATTEISKFNESLSQHDSEIRETINVFKNVVEGKSDELGKAIAATIQEMSTNIGNVTSKFSDLNNSINSYTITTNDLKENNIKTHSIVSDLITKLNDSTTNIMRENRKFVEELKEISSNNIEALQKTVQNNISDQTESLTDIVEDLQTSINKLSSSLSKNLEKLSVDVDAICTSIDEMKQISQNVETSDKELLAKILKYKK